MYVCFLFSIFFIFSVSYPSDLVDQADVISRHRIHLYSVEAVPVGTRATPPSLAPVLPVARPLSRCGSPCERNRACLLAQVMLCACVR